MDQLDLSSFFKTKSEASDFSTRLSAISEKMYQNDFNLEKELREQLGVLKKDKFVTMLRDNNLNVESNAALKEFFSKIQEKISSLSVLSLKIAFEPTEQTLESLSEWFILNIKKQVLFAITIDPSLIAGAAITINGKHRDFSIKLKFDQVLKDVLAKNAEPTTPTDETKPTELLGGHQSIDHIHLGR
jgi:hypothetical protein